MWERLFFPAKNTFSKPFFHGIIRFSTGWQKHANRALKPVDFKIWCTCKHRVSILEARADNRAVYGLWYVFSNCRTYVTYNLDMIRNEIWKLHLRLHIILRRPWEIYWRNAITSVGIARSTFLSELQLTQCLLTQYSLMWLENTLKHINKIININVTCNCLL